VDRERSGARSGFTLVEAIVAVAIVGILLAGVAGTFTGYLRINTDSEARTGAVAAAQTVMDRLRSPGGWPTSGTVESVDSHGRTYEVEIRYKPYSEGGVIFAGARSVEVEVRHAGRTRYVVETVFTQLD
jgi:prepilin-type N-terminal cleavage/methylation domain-containing protein